MRVQKRLRQSMVSVLSGVVIAALSAGGVGAVVHPAVAEAEQPGVRAGRQEFTSNGTWRVPPDVREVVYTAFGGRGGANTDAGEEPHSFSEGGRGAKATGVIPLASVNSVVINVGMRGADAPQGRGSFGGAGGLGYRSGGRGGDGGSLAESQGAGGGGSSAILISALPVVIAAGGGGAGGQGHLKVHTHAGAGGDAGRAGNGSWGCSEAGNAAGGKPGAPTAWNDSGADAENATRDLFKPNPNGAGGGGGAGGGNPGAMTPWEDSRKCASSAAGAPGGGGGGGASLVPEGASVGVDDREGGNGDGVVILEWEELTFTRVSVSSDQVRTDGLLIFRADVWQRRLNLPARGRVEFSFAGDDHAAAGVLVNGVATAPMNTREHYGIQEYRARFIPEPGSGFAPSSTAGSVYVAPPGNTRPPELSPAEVAGIGVSVTVSEGEWERPAQIREFTYQWYRSRGGDGPVEIPGATGGAYLTTGDDHGAVVYAVVTARYQGFPDASATSSRVRVLYVPEVRLRIESGQHAVARISALPGLLGPGERVVFEFTDLKTQGIKVLGAVTDPFGIARVFFGGLPPGLYQARAVYEGNSVTMPGKSEPQTVVIGSE